MDRAASYPGHEGKSLLCHRTVRCMIGSRCDELSWSLLLRLQEATSSIFTCCFRSITSIILQLQCSYHAGDWSYDQPALVDGFCWLYDVRALGPLVQLAPRICQTHDTQAVNPLSCFSGAGFWYVRVPCKYGTGTRLRRRLEQGNHGKVLKFWSSGPGNFTASTPSSRVTIPWYDLHIIRCTASLQ